MVLMDLPVFVIPELFFHDPVGKDCRTDNAFELEVVRFEPEAGSPGATRDPVPVPVPVNETIFQRFPTSNCSSGESDKAKSLRF